MKRLFLIISLLLTACGKQAESTAEVVKYDPAEGLDVLDVGIVKSIEIVPLEVQDGSLIGDNPQLVLSGGDYYVVDQSGGKVLRFGADGKFLNSIGQQGRGPSEYAFMDNATVVDSTIYIHSSQNDAEFIYGKNGNFIRKDTLPFYAQQILHLPDRTLYYLGYGNDRGDARVVETKGGGVEEYLPSAAKIFPLLEVMPALVPGGDSVFVRESLSNEIYSIRNGAARVAYRFDYGQYNIPAEYFKMDDAEQAGNWLFVRKFALQQLFLTSDQWVVMSAFMQKQDAFTLAYGFKNRATGVWQWCNYSGRDNPSIFFGDHVLKLLTDTDLYFMVDPGKLLRSSLRNSPLLRNPEALDTLGDDGNYVILKCGVRS